MANLSEYYSGQAGAEDLDLRDIKELARAGETVRYDDPSQLPDDRYLRQITDYYGGAAALPVVSPQTGKKTGQYNVVDNPKYGPGGTITVQNPMYTREAQVTRAFNLADKYSAFLPPDQVRSEVYKQSGIDIGVQTDLSTPKGRERMKELTGLADVRSQITARDVQAAENRADIEKKQRELRNVPIEARNTAETAIANLDRLSQNATSIRENKDLWRSVGLVGWLPNIRGSAASDITADIESLKSQVAFGALQAMRDASKTGGALGNVSDTEVRRLEATMAALSEAQSPAQYRQRLEQVINQVKVSQDRIARAYREQYGDQTNLNINRDIATAPPASVVQKMQPGIPATFANGQVWILGENGQPKRLK